MKECNITVPVSQLTEDELSPELRELVKRARQATYRAYAPYSRFHVGAAIKLSNGETITGSNQENAAFPSSICAERTACYYAYSRHPEAKFEAIAIAARGENGQPTDWPIPPCGACRQALLEYEKLAGHPVRVLLVGKDDIYSIPSVKALLPIAFEDF